MSAKRNLLTPAVWGFYLVVVLEFLFMISPLALPFYSAYGPALNVVHASPWTSWLTGFFLPHFSMTASPMLSALKPLGFALAAAGLLAFLLGAVQVYGAKLLRRDAVTGGLYRVIRHPQYLALAVLGFGVTLIWPRFLVLLSYLTMLFLYYLLARWEENQCLAKYGESYRRYQERTGMFLPRLFSRAQNRSGEQHGPLRVSSLAALFVVTLLVGVVAAMGLRSYSLAQVTSSYHGRVAVLSPAILDDQELEAAYRLALTDGALATRLSAAGPSARILAYVVPMEWLLPDLPLHSLEEIRQSGGGHDTPAFDRQRYKVLFSRARLHATDAQGPSIVTRAYGHDPIRIVHVDIGRRQVLRSQAPPDHVVWGDIPTPLF